MPDRLEKDSLGTVRVPTEAKDKFIEHFPLYIFRAGAGTPMNMNVNEVLANLATEKLGGKKGDYPVHPNNYVNMAQSTNDVVQTAIRLALALQTPALLVELVQLAEAFEKKAKQYDNTIKVGRTHLQDAILVLLKEQAIPYTVIPNPEFKS